MELVRIAGIDPSLRNTGIAIADVCPEENVIVSVVGIHLIHTEPSKNKKRRKSSADFESATTIAYNLRKHLKGCNFIFAEIPSGTQSARASWSLGISLGIVASISPSPIEITPQMTKTAACGTNTATKGEMIEWATTKYPDLNWRVRAGRYLNINEHMADAVGVIHAGIESPEWDQIRRAITYYHEKRDSG
jgi:Holliday junction resolvasome RuvABC endonuclease subunit